MSRFGLPFVDAMVAAVLRGDKDVTRRLDTGDKSPWKKRGPGDVGVARECHTLVDGPCWVNLPYRAHQDPDDATWSYCYYRTGFDRTEPRWRSALVMPWWASRFSCVVVSLRREPTRRGRVLFPEVDDAEARREGVADRDTFVRLFQELHDPDDLPDHLWRVEFRPELLATQTRPEVVIR